MQRDNNRCKKRAQNQVKASVEFLKQFGWFEEDKKKERVYKPFIFNYALSTRWFLNSLVQ